MKFLQTEPEIEILNNNLNDLYYTVLKKRDEKEIVNDKHENNEKDYFNYEDFITPNHYSGRKNEN